MREKFRTANDDVRDVERQITDLEKKAGTDYGPDGRFEAISRECFEWSPGGEFSYEVKSCPPFTRRDHQM